MKLMTEQQLLSLLRKAARVRRLAVAELPDNRSRLTRWIASAMLSLALGMFVGHFAIEVFDRFYQNDTLKAFYAPGTDATCWVYKLRGEQTMSCLPGDHRVEEDRVDG